MVKFNRTITSFGGTILLSLVLWTSGSQEGKPGWRKLVFEKVTLLPLTPIPRGPTWRETLREGRQPVPGGPAMAIVRGQSVYVVDDVKRKLLECSMKGEVLKELTLPKDAPKSLSGVLSICSNLLWVGFEGFPYAFAVDIENWNVVEERRWKGKGVVAGLFSMPDRTLYAIMPAKVDRGHVIWQLIKITPEGKQKEQIVEGWRPAFVDTEGVIYWVNCPKQLLSDLMIARGKFELEPKMMAKIHGQRLKEAYKVYSSGWAYGVPIVGITRDGVLARGDFISKEWMSWLLLHFSWDGRIEIIGEEPTFMRPIRSLDLPDWWICEGKIYGIMREHVGENSRFWLVRLKL